MRARALVLAALWSGAACALAQPVPADRMREQLRDTVLQLRSLQAEHRALQLRERQLTQQLQAAQQEKAAAPPPPVRVAPAVDLRRLSALREELARERRTSAEALARAESGETALQQEQAGSRRLAAERDRQAQELAALRGQLQAGAEQQRLQAEAVARCSADNRELAALGDELLQAYRRKDVWAALRDDEPLLGFGRVRLENLIQTWRGRLEDHRLAPTQASTPTGDAAGPGGQPDRPREEPR